MEAQKALDYEMALQLFIAESAMDEGTDSSSMDHVKKDWLSKLFGYPSGTSSSVEYQEDRQIETNYRYRKNMQSLLGERRALELAQGHMNEYITAQMDLSSLGSRSSSSEQVSRERSGYPAQGLPPDKTWAGESSGRGMLVEEWEGEASDAAETECGICMEGQPSTSFITLQGCDHAFCVPCLINHSEARVESGALNVSCPAVGCLNVLCPEQCDLVLSGETLMKLGKRQTEAAIPDDMKVYCPYSNCSALMEKPDGTGESFGECVVCSRTFCIPCAAPWHSGLTCEEFQDARKQGESVGEKGLHKLAREQKWQRCQNCKRYVDKTEGCIHMTCLCKHEFCYICGGKWPCDGGRTSSRR